MTEWTVCPSCQLKHSVRNDGLCPRCHQSVAAGAPADDTVPAPGSSMFQPQLQPPPMSAYVPPPAKRASPVKWVLFATVAIVVALGLQGLGSFSGRQVVFKLMYGLEGEPVSQVDGKTLPYHLTLASANKWYLRSDGSAHRDNAAADRWLVCPEKNAHVITIVEQVELGPNQYLDMDKLEGLVIDNMRKNVSKYIVHGTDRISRPMGGRLIHGTAEVSGFDAELYHAVFIDGARVYQVLAFTEKKNFAEMSGELVQIIETMRLP